MSGRCKAFKSKERFLFLVEWLPHGITNWSWPELKHVVIFILVIAHNMGPGPNYLGRGRITPTRLVSYGPEAWTRDGGIRIGSAQSVTVPIPITRPPSARPVGKRGRKVPVPPPPYPTATGGEPGFGNSMLIQRLCFQKCRKCRGTGGKVLWQPRLWRHNRDMVIYYESIQSLSEYIIYQVIYVNSLEQTCKLSEVPW